MPGPWSRTVITASLLALTSGFAFDGRRELLFGAAHLMSRYLMVPMLLVWWALAVKRYLRLPHRWAVVLLLTLLICLLFVPVLWILAPDFLLTGW